MKRCNLSFAMWVVVALAAARSAQGNVALLIEEPYGLFGSVNPTGHSAIYLIACALNHRPCCAGVGPTRRGW